MMLGDERMNKTRMLGIFNNLMLECQSSGHLDNEQINEVMNILVT